LAKAKLEVLDYTELLDMSREEHVLGLLDMHPSHLTNKVLAQALVTDLGL
jgi:hypothetical protein